MKGWGLMLLVFYISGEVRAQTGMNKIARAGEQGIYVYNAYPMCSKEVPDKEGGIRIAIQRKDNEQLAWKNIGYFQAPSSLLDLADKYKKWSPYVLDRTFLNPQWIGGCWENIQKHHHYDSTLYYASDQVMMMAIGRLFLDTTVQKGKKYEYQFLRITASGESKVLGTSTTVTYPETQLLSQPKLLRREAEQDLVKVTWFLKKSKKPAFFKVYRRTAGIGNIWENIVPDRIIAVVKPDTIALVMLDREISPNQNYDYFIRLSDSFGNYAPNSDTASVLSYKYQDISMPYRFHTKSLDSLHAIELRWNVKDKHLMSGLEVYRSLEYDGQYQLIGRTSVDDTTFRDRDVEPMRTYYYYLRAVDQQGRHSVKSVRAYGNLTDAAQPMTPGKVKVKQTPKGIQVSWQKRGLFVEDFYVYRGLGIEGTMQKITSLLHCKDTICSYLDTTSRLQTEYPYGYAVTQVNTSHKESVLSDMVYIQPVASNKIVPLSAPTQLTAQKTSAKVALLLWEDVSLLQSQVKGYEVYKKTGSQTDFALLTKVPLPTSHHHYKDTTYRADEATSYYVKSIGAKGSSSSKPSSIVSIRNEALIPLPPSDLAATQIMDEKSVQLTWHNPKGSAFKTLQLFKAEQKKGAEPKLLTQLASNEESFVDKDVQQGKSYFYYLVSLSSEGKESERSNVVFVQMVQP